MATLCLGPLVPPMAGTRASSPQAPRPPGTRTPQPAEPPKGWPQLGAGRERPPRPGPQCSRGPAADNNDKCPRGPWFSSRCGDHPMAWPPGRRGTRRIQESWARRLLGAGGWGALPAARPVLQGAQALLGWPTEPRQVLPHCPGAPAVWWEGSAPAWLGHVPDRVVRRQASCHAGCSRRGSE